MSFREGDKESTSLVAKSAVKFCDALRWRQMRTALLPSGWRSPQQVAMIRASTKDRTQPWTVAELRASLPQPLDRKEWKLTASDKPGDAKLAIDGRIDTRCTTGTSQKPGQWFQVEISKEATITGLQLDGGKSKNDYPRGYKVEISSDGQQWKEVASGKGSNAVTDVQFPATKVKFVRITQTGAVGGLYWSIHELNIFSSNGTPVASAGAAGPSGR